jgi:hypothetical protein
MNSLPFMDETGELKTYLDQKLSELREKDSKDHRSLLDSLLEWGAAIPSSDTVYESMIIHIGYQSRKKSITPKEFVDYLFSQKNYDSWMRAFQE